MKSRAEAAGARLPAWLLIFAFGLALYLITLPADLRNNGDTVDRFFVTQQMVHGHVDVACPRPGQPRPSDSRLVRGVSGCYYAIYGPGQSLLMAPLYALGKGVAAVTGLEHDFSTAIVTRSLDPILGALLLVVFYLLCLEVGYRRRSAILLTLILGFASTVWPDVQSGQETTATALALVASVYALTRAVRERSRADLERSPVGRARSPAYHQPDLMAVRERAAPSPWSPTSPDWSVESWLKLAGLAAGFGIFMRYDFAVDACILAAFVLTLLAQNLVASPGLQSSSAPSGADFARTRSGPIRSPAMGAKGQLSTAAGGDRGPVRSHVAAASDPRSRLGGDPSSRTTGIAAVGLPTPADMPRMSGRYDFAAGARGLSSFLLGLLPFLLAIGFWNQIRFGAVWRIGQAIGTPFGFPLWQGVGGLLVSPGKGLLWYLPLLWLVPFAVGGFRRRVPWLTWLILSLFAGSVLFYANVVYWHGDPAWGPRYLFVVVPLVLLPLGELLERFVEFGRSKQGAIVAVVGLSLALQLVAVGADPWRFWYHLIEQRRQAGQLFTWSPTSYGYYWSRDAGLDPELYQFAALADVVGIGFGGGARIPEASTAPQASWKRHCARVTTADARAYDGCELPGVSLRPLNTVSPIWLNDRYQWINPLPVPLPLTVRILILSTLGGVGGLAAVGLHLQYREIP